MERLNLPESQCQVCKEKDAYDKFVNAYTMIHATHFERFNRIQNYI